MVRSDSLIRLLTVPPGSILETSADSSDGTSGFVLTRYREFWGDQGPNNDVLTVNGLDIISPTNCPISKLVNAMFVFDDNLDGVNNLVTPNAFYFALPFITAMDVLLPAADPPDGVIHIDNTSRDGLTATIERAELGVEQEHDVDHPECPQPAQRAGGAGRQGPAQVRGRHLAGTGRVREGQGRMRPEVPGRPAQGGGAVCRL